MGFLSQHATTKNTASDAVRRGERLWNRTFGITSKEDGDLAKFPKVRDRQSWTRGAIAEPAAYKRLLQAMRSMAPGGWSDDRWEQAQHYTGIAYAGIKKTGEQLSVSEFQVFRKDPDSQDGKVPVTPDDPPEGGRLCKPYDLVKLLERPNNDDGFGDWIEQGNLQMELTGMHLTWMVPNQLGIPHELYTIPTSIAIPQPAVNPDYPDGYYRIQPIYPYGPFSSYPTPATAVGAPIPAQWMLRIKYPHPILRYDGYSPLTALRLQLDEIEQMDRTRWYSMKRIINPSAVLNFDDLEGSQPLPEAEILRMRAEFENDFQSPENSGRLFVASPGSKLEIAENRLRDLEFKDGWSQLVEFALGAGFGITKPAAGMVEDSSYSTLFATLKQLWLLTLGPRCERIARQLTHHVAPFFGDDLIIEIRPKRIDDPELKKQNVDTLMAAKAITKNEVRKECDFPVTKKEWGDEIAGAEEQAAQMGAFPGSPNGQGQAPGQAPQMPNAPAAVQDPDLEDLLNDDAALATSPMEPKVSGSERDMVKPAPTAVEKERPKTGMMAAGGSVPRKEIGQYFAKSKQKKERPGKRLVYTNSEKMTYMSKQLDFGQGKEPTVLERKDYLDKQLVSTNGSTLH